MPELFLRKALQGASVTREKYGIDMTIVTVDGSSMPFAGRDQHMGVDGARFIFVDGFVGGCCCLGLWQSTQRN